MFLNRSWDRPYPSTPALLRWSFFIEKSSVKKAGCLLARWSDRVGARELATTTLKGLPFNASIGDSLVASFTFDPDLAAPPYVQTGSLKFSVGNAELTLMNYKIDVRDNDLPGPVDVPGRIADPLNTPVLDFFPRANDNIVISSLSGGIPLSGPLPGTISGYPDFTFSPLIVFAYEDEVLDSGVLPRDTNVWNRFSFREMSLTIRNAGTGSEAYIGAYVGLVRQIPEAASIKTFLLCLGFLVIRQKSHL